MRLREQREATHARALPDQVRDIDRRLAPCRVSQRGQDATHGKRGDRVTRQGTAHAVDGDIHPAASRQASDAIGETLRRDVVTLSKPRARACSALAGLVVVEIAFAAPCARANWVTALPTAPPMAGARTVWPGSKPACVSVICAVR